MTSSPRSTRHLHRGDKSWSIDMQRTTSYGAALLPDRGRTAGRPSCATCAYQATTTDYLGRHRGGRRRVDLGARRCLSTAARASPARWHRSRTGARRSWYLGVNVLNTPWRPAGDRTDRGRSTVIPAQEVVEGGLAAASAAGADGCVVLVEEGSHADVRYALNSTTTNGVQRNRYVSDVVTPTVPWARHAVRRRGLRRGERHGGRRARRRPAAAGSRGRLRARHADRRLA